MRGQLKSTVTVRGLIHNWHFEYPALESQVGLTTALRALGVAQYILETGTRIDGPPIEHFCNKLRHVGEIWGNGLARWSRHKIENSIRSFTDHIQSAFDFVAIGYDCQHTPSNVEEQVEANQFAVGGLLPFEVFENPTNLSCRPNCSCLKSLDIL